MGNDGKKIFLGLLLIALVGFAFFYFSNPKVKTQVDFQVNTATSTLGSIVNQGENQPFAGFTWDIKTEGNLRQCGDNSDRHPQSCSSARGTFNIDEDGLANIGSSASSSFYWIRAGFCQPPSSAVTCMTTQEEISDIDEFLIIWEGSGSAGVQLSILDKSTGERKAIISRSGSFDAELVKFQNDFTGKYTLFKRLGVGDLFLIDKTIDTTNFQSRHLQICVSASARCEDQHKGNSQSGSIKVYNIVTKRLESAVCQADEIPLPDGSCQQLNLLELIHESAIFETLASKLERIEKRLGEREIALQQRISDFQLFLSISSKEEKLAFINSKLIELQSRKLQVESEHLQNILSLESNAVSIEEEIEQRILDNAPPSRTEILKEQLTGVNQEIEFLKTLDPSIDIQEQIDFFNAQKTLIETGAEARIEFLEKELLITQQVLDGIKEGIINAPPDVDIEIVIKAVTDELNKRIDAKIIELRNQGLTEAQIIELLRNEQLVDRIELNEIISKEMSSQFEERFPSGLQPIIPPPPTFPITPVLIVLSIIGLLFFIFRQRK